MPATTAGTREGGVRDAGIDTVRTCGPSLRVTLRSTGHWNCGVFGRGSATGGGVDASMPGNGVGGSVRANASVPQLGMRRNSGAMLPVGANRSSPGSAGTDADVLAGGGGTGWVDLGRNVAAASTGAAVGPTVGGFMPSRVVAGRPSRGSTAGNSTN